MHNHWLFIGNVFAHWVATMSSIVSFTLGIVEYVRDKKTEGWIFWIVAGEFLVVSFDSAWQDEHRNSQTLATQKNSAVMEANFWKEQSYGKDASLHSRDQLLEQNYTALIGEQATAGKAQNSLTKLSEKILEVSKPEKLKIFDHYLGTVDAQYNPGIHTTYHGTFLVLTNQTVTPVRLLVTCGRDLEQAVGKVLGTGAEMVGGWGGRVTSSAKSYGVGILSPAWTPANPMVVTVYTNQKDIGTCSFEEK